MKWCARNDVIERSLLADYEVRRAPIPAKYMPTEQDMRLLLSSMEDFWDIGHNRDVRYCSTAKRTFHRERNYAIDQRDIYFVTNVQDRAVDMPVAFRVGGAAPWVWNPYTGRVSALYEYDERNGVTYVPVRLAPYESTYYVFEKNERRPHATTTSFAWIEGADDTSVTGWTDRGGDHLAIDPSTDVFPWAFPHRIGAEGLVSQFLTLVEPYAERRSIDLPDLALHTVHLTVLGFRKVTLLPPVQLLLEQVQVVQRSCIHPDDAVHGVVIENMRSFSRLIKSRVLLLHILEFTVYYFREHRQGADGMPAPRLLLGQAPPPGFGPIVRTYNTRRGIPAWVSASVE